MAFSNSNKRKAEYAPGSRNQGQMGIGGVDPVQRSELMIRRVRDTISDTIGVNAQRKACLSEAAEIEKASNEQRAKDSRETHEKREKLEQLIGRLTQAVTRLQEKEGGCLQDDFPALTNIKMQLMNIIQPGVTKNLENKLAEAETEAVSKSQSVTKLEENVHNLTQQLAREREDLNAQLKASMEFSTHLAETEKENEKLSEVAKTCEREQRSLREEVKKQSSLYAEALKISQEQGHLLDLAKTEYEKLQSSFSLKATALRESEDNRSSLCEDLKSVQSDLAQSELKARSLEEKLDVANMQITRLRAEKDIVQDSTTVLSRTDELTAEASLERTAEAPLEQTTAQSKSSRRGTEVRGTQGTSPESELPDGAVELEIADAKQFNFPSSLPQEVTRLLAEQVRAWDTKNPGWATQRVPTKLNCIQSRVGRNQATFMTPDGNVDNKHACKTCQFMRRVCCTMASQGKIMLMPVRQKENSTFLSTDSGFWIRT